MKQLASRIKERSEKIRQRLRSNSKNILVMDVVLLMAASLLVFAVPEPEVTKGLEVAGSTYSTAELKWSAADNAKAYRIYRSGDGSDYQYLASTADTGYTDKGLMTGRTYYYKVVSRNVFKSNALNDAKSVEVTPELGRPELSVDTAKGHVDLSFSAVDGAIGYEIYRNGKVIASQEGTEFTDESAKGDKKYNYKVKAFRYIKQPVYSRASNTVKAVMHAVQNFAVDTEEDDLIFEWDRNEHYDKYKLFNGDELLTETEGDSYKLSGLKLKKTYDIKLIGYSEDGSTQSPVTGRRFSVTEEPMDNEEARNRACDWGVEIAADDSFTYGTGRRSHNYGCYFCGTNVGPNMNKKGKSLVSGHSYEKTYCCNPFVTACYAHGAEDPALLNACRHGRGVGFTAKSYTRYGGWKSMGKLSQSELQKGDVLCWTSHVMMYIGDGKIVHAKTEGWGGGTITVDNCSSYYKRVVNVMRYTGSGSGTMLVINDVDENGKVISEDKEEKKDA